MYHTQLLHIYVIEVKSKYKQAVTTHRDVDRRMQCFRSPNTLLALPAAWVHPMFRDITFRLSGIDAPNLQLVVTVSTCCLSARREHEILQSQIHPIECVQRIKCLAFCLQVDVELLYTLKR
jgi:hypothetical protein